MMPDCFAASGASATTRCLDSSIKSTYPHYTMQLSADTEAVLSHLDTITDGGLRKRSDVGVLLELGASTGNFELFNTILRSGTGLWKVYGALRHLAPGAEGYHQMEQEFGLQLNALREHLASMVQSADDGTLQRFDDIYFGMTQGVIRNLVDLGHDLARIKALQHDGRQG